MTKRSLSNSPIKKRLKTFTVHTNKKLPEKLEFPKSLDCKISSWNIAGANAAIKKGVDQYIVAEDADIICLQETKLTQPVDGLIKKSQYPHQYWSHCLEKKGYSGTVVGSKIKPLKVIYGMNKPKFDNEGRLITLEFQDFYLVAAYIPNAGQGLKRLDYKREWMTAFQAYIESLEDKKPIVLAGDLNVAHTEMDLTNPKTNTKTAGFTPEERSDFTRLLMSDKYPKIDTFRHFYPNVKDAYTYFSYRFNCREKNIGWRLDYFLCSEKLMDRVIESSIRNEVYGVSDHVPLVLVLKKNDE